MSFNQLLSKAKAKLETVLTANPVKSFSIEHPKHILFFVASNGSERAHIEIAVGDSFEDSWVKGVAGLKHWRLQKGQQPIWLRVEAVHSVESLSWLELKEKLKRAKRNYFRFGLSFTADFSTAMLEHELYANALLYKTDVSVATANETNLKNYGKRRFGRELEWPNNDQDIIWRFKTRAVFTDGKDTHEIEHDGRNSGYRLVEDWGVDAVTDIVTTSTDYLAKQVKNDGLYQYGWFPCFDRAIPTYNALRHASSTYALLEGWEVTQERKEKRAIDRALDYLTHTLIKHVELPNGDKAAFLVDLGDEIKLGGNAVCILAYAKYTEITGDKKYLGLMEELALGIVHMQKPETGEYVHILNYPDLSVKAENRIIYYDGEAAFGLMRLYGLTKDPRWLASVEKAFDYFIEQDHWKAHDHWLSYCVNELTLYNPDPKYYKFGLDNIRDHLDFVLTRITTYPTLLELMMAAQRMIERMQNDPSVSYLLDDFDVDKFYRALEYRARYLLNGFFYPEVAMFFKNPARILGGFFIRHHTFRSRIDDVEHYLSGYVAYRKYLKNMKMVETVQNNSDQNIIYQSVVPTEEVKKPKISVVIPLYNREREILNCLDSLAAQSLSQDLFEVIVVDDCSTDGSVETIKQYKKIKNLRLKVLEKNSRGASKPRNVGIDVAAGDYILFIDSDDSITKHALDLALKQAIAGDLDMVAISIFFDDSRKAYTSLFKDYPNGIAKANLQADKKLGSVVFANPGIVGRLYKASKLKESGVRFSEKMRIYEDTLFSRFIYSISDTFGLVSPSLAHYYPAPAEEVNNLSLLKRTVERCVLYISEALRMCNEIPDTVISKKRKNRILNNALCRNNIYNTVNNSKGYEALALHLDSLLPLVSEEGIRDKAKNLIRMVCRTKSMQDSLKQASEYFSSDQTAPDLIADYRKTWVWQTRTLVIDFEFYGFRIGVDINAEFEGYQLVELVLRGEAQKLKVDWSVFGQQRGNRVHIFSHATADGLTSAFVNISDVLRRVKAQLNPKLLTESATV